MKQALVLQHMDHDTPGRFLDYFIEDGIRPRSVRLWEGQEIPPLKDFDLMFVLGGAMDVWELEENPWLKGEMQAIREWVAERGKPYIGLCLGHQLLAKALGGEVGLAQESEVGVHEVTVNGAARGHRLFEGLRGSYKVMQWHHAEVKTPPKEATVLAASPRAAVQAIAIDDHALGLQFHAEFSAQTVASWESLPSFMAALERELGAGAYAKVSAEAYPLMPQMGAMARRIYDNLKSASGLVR
ncbi:type 1 glutamine amidotransferase [Taklimakanibacter deserti]|uniref:type 1 glutamine amidotransferase n=1 Tax=Taklimakanibacter deserti TaxID=2267839 RepID=UPI0013C4CC19